MRRAKGGGKNSEHGTYSGFCKGVLPACGKNAPKVCGLYLARQTHAPTKNLDRYAVFYGTACPFDNDNMRATAAKVCVWGGTAGQKRRKKCDAAQKTQPCAALEAKACDKNGCYKNGCYKKTLRRALSFDLTGEIAYNLCITTCGVCRKNKGVTVC